jgi:hypothetical protein
MDTQTIVLISVGVLTICAMVYFILRKEPVEQESKEQEVHREQHEETFDEESNYTTINESDGGEESIFDS